MTDVNTTPETAETQEAPSIGLPDIANALRIIDAAAERGAFRGPELSQVGAVRDRIATFLEAVLPKQEEAATEGAATDGAATESAAEEAPKDKKAAKKK